MLYEAIRRSTVIGPKYRRSGGEHPLSLGSLPFRERRAVSLSLPELLRRMLLIRTLEERLRALVRESKAPITSPTAGQEASALGVIDALGPDDLLLTNHRSMSHLLARGADLGRVLAEVYGKRTGYC